jgi:hypothetical protein
VGEVSLEVVERPGLIEEMESRGLRSRRVEQGCVVPCVLLEPVAIYVWILDEDGLRMYLGMLEVRCEIPNLIAG